MNIPYNSHDLRGFLKKLVGQQEIQTWEISSV